MEEPGKPMDSVTFQSGIDFETLSIMIKFDHPIPAVCMDVDEARKFGLALIELSKKLDTAIMIRGVAQGMIAAGRTASGNQKQSEVSSGKESDAVRTETDHQAVGIPPGGGPDPKC